MDSEAFHNRVIATFKQALSSWDYDNNPLCWEGLPADVSKLVTDVMQQSLDESVDGPFGAPFFVKFGHFSGQGKVHHPFPDAVLKIELLPFKDSDEYAKAEFNLADAILTDATGADKGWTVGHAINQLEGTIKKLRSVAKGRGWDVSYEPG